MIGTKQQLTANTFMNDLDQRGKIIAEYLKQMIADEDGEEKTEDENNAENESDEKGE